MSRKALAIVVGGGPAPGINGVISAATIEAINRGHRVYGINHGFQRISLGDQSALRELKISDVSRIPREGGSILYTSRANPTKDPKMLQNVIELLRSHDVGYLITIGGDDTANSARVIAQSAGSGLAVGHVPKTIDNDLPLPDGDSTFGYQSAREAGTDVVEHLTADARSTGRWYLVVAMGRKAGHLALGIGISSGATLSIIPEQFGFQTIALPQITEIIVGAILKRLMQQRSYGVVVLAEGLAELLDPATVPELSQAERDPHGNIRFAEVDFGRIVREAVKQKLGELGVKLTIVDKNVGYELRCVPPNPFDREYTRLLGFGIVDFLLNGGTEAMISRQKNTLVPIPFSELIDPLTGKTKIRTVDLDSLIYRVGKKYMIELTAEDLKNQDFCAKLAGCTKLTPQELVAELRYLGNPN